MKKTIVTLFLLVIQTMAFACPVCERAKAKKMFGSIGHGIGPQSNWDYIAVWGMIIITILTLFYTIKWLIKPGEKNKSHVKYSILNFESL